MAKKDEIKQPQYYMSRINTQVMNYNVYVMPFREKLMYLSIIAICGGLVGLIFYGGLFKQNGAATLATYISNVVVFAVVALLAIKFFMPVVTESLRQRRLKKLRAQFCDFATSLTNALASGMNMRDALSAVCTDLQSQYSDGEMIVQEVRELLNGVHNNIPIEVMLADFGARSGIPDITNFSIVFGTCYRTGGDIKSVVRRTTEIISEKLVIASEIETAITSNKMQMNVMNLLPIVIILMMRFLSAEFAESFGTVIGVVALSISAALFIAAYKLGQKIIHIEG